jgi:DNA-binding CsgD family transcriptional regulator
LECGAGRGLDPGSAMAIPRTSGRPLQILVYPFHSSSRFADEYLCAIVFLSDPDIKMRSRSAILTGVYRLSPAECRLADYLVQGLELAEAAERMRITLATARFMLKCIFRKTETHRQSELVRLLVRLPAPAMNQ